MSYLHLPLTPQVDMGDVFSDMPVGAKNYIRGGFSVLAKIPATARPALLQAAIQATGQRKGERDEQLAKALGLTVDQSTSAVAALGMLAAISSSRKDPPERIVNAMVAAKVINESDTQALLALMPEITEKSPEIRKAVGTRALSDSVLQSFSGLETALDLRLGGKEFDELVVPIAIAHLRTDARDGQVWFQMTKEDVENVAKQLDSLLKDFKRAEEMIGKLSTSSGGK